MWSCPYICVVYTCVLLLSGERMSAQEAMNYGLVSKVFPTEDLVRERGRKEGDGREEGRE